MDIFNGNEFFKARIWVPASLRAKGYYRETGRPEVNASTIRSAMEKLKQTAKEEKLLELQRLPRIKHGNDEYSVHREFTDALGRNGYEATNRRTLKKEIFYIEE